MQKSFKNDIMRMRNLKTLKTKCPKIIQPNNKS